MPEDDKLNSALGALYRGLPREEPPPAIDSAILSAARSSIGARPARRWAVPVSLAAVLVLSVGVTLRVAEERPDFESAGVPPPVASSSSPAAISRPVAAEPSPAESAELSAVKEATPKLTPPPASVAGGPPATATPRAKPSADSAGHATEPTPQFVPAPREKREPMAPVPSAPPPIAAERSAESAASAAPAAERRSMSALRRDAAQAGPTGNLASAGAPAAAKAASPEAWLERIADLRSQGRNKEADESYADFRLRYPEYKPSQEMLQRIAPPR